MTTHANATITKRGFRNGEYKLQRYACRLQTIRTESDTESVLLERHRTDVPFAPLPSNPSVHLEPDSVECPIPLDECTQALGLNPRLFRAHRGRAELHVTLLPALADLGFPNMLNDLQRVTWQIGTRIWVVDVSHLPQLKLPLLDALLRLGIYVHGHGGQLRVSGLREAQLDTAFRDLFIGRCQALQVAIDMNPAA